MRRRGYRGGALLLSKKKTPGRQELLLVGTQKAVRQGSEGQVGHGLIPRGDDVVVDQLWHAERRISPAVIS